MKLRVLFLCAALAAVPTVASAQSNSAQAEQLFRDGKTLMGQKKYAEACEAFDASHKMDPQSTTLMNLADCREKNNQLATAWGLFLDVERVTRSGSKADKALGTAAKARADKLEPRLSYLIVNVPDESRIDGLTISRNGEVIDPGTWNRALPVDGGEYVIEGKAPGHEPWSTRVNVGMERDKQSVDVPKFKAVPLPDPNTVKPDGDGTGGAVDEPDEPIDTGGGGMSGKRKAAIGVGVGGVVLLGVAGYFELNARSKYDESVDEADDMRQDALFNDAVSSRKIAIGTGIAGGVCVGVAAFLWFTGGAESAPDETALRVLPSVGPDQIGLAFGGGF
jgi:tetratricopeptide (TPR) repeat protein